MWVRSWFKRGLMAELTPGTQLSMGSAKRLYVLMAGFYTRWAFKTSAVKSRHRIFTFTSSRMCVRAPLVSLPAPHVSSLSVRETFPLKWPATTQIIPYMFRAEGLSSGCHWEFTFNVQPSDSHDRRRAFWEFRALSFKRMWRYVKVKCTQRKKRNVQTNWIILEIVINFSLKLWHPWWSSQTSKAQREEEGEKKKKRKIPVRLRRLVQHVACILWFPHPRQSQRMFWQNKKPHVSNVTDTQGMQRGGRKGKRGVNWKDKEKEVLSLDLIHRNMASGLASFSLTSVTCRSSLSLRFIIPLKGPMIPPACKTVLWQNTLIWIEFAHRGAK